MISKSLVGKAMDYYALHRNKEVVVNPSLPILYFGDSKGFRESPLKIVTVAKNPSLNEFRMKKGDSYSFARFPNWIDSESNLTEVLDSYFELNPFKRWFSSFEPILNGLEASYYHGTFQNRVLHTDICSPIATDPTWGKLPEQTRKDLFDGGLSIWKELIEELAPDVMLVSFGKGLFQSVFKSSGDEFLVFSQKRNGEDRKYPYSLTVQDYSLSSGKVVKVVFGSAANTPFGLIANQQKACIAQEILKILPV